ncbi:MAG TPA: hypothetical protein VMG10_35230 [Gemmataceae bacterium]|nr:hypothetical protein [Gemmataceae bacterium]
MFRRTTAIGFSLVLLTVRADGAPAPRGKLPPRPLRILLVASSATREYQFLRSLLVRESEAKRAELAIHLQAPPGREGPRAGVVQDVPKERLLDTFPTRLDGYDVVVAFDPDWARLTGEAQTALQEWVRKKGGGLVLIAGPINTMQLARAAPQRKLAPIRDLYPVVVIDLRLLETAIDTSKPRRLTFPRTRAKYPFLKLDSKGKGNRAGWQEFFGEENVAKKKESEPRRGFFSYFPVESLKSDAVVLAALADPKVRRKDGKDQPYLVARQMDKGRVMYFGSGELWRLRLYRREYYERFWLGLLAYLAEPRP